MVELWDRTGPPWRGRYAADGFHPNDWADRIRHSAFAHQAKEQGLAGEADLADLAAAWHRWADEDGAVFLVPHGEVRCRA